MAGGANRSAADMSTQLWQRRFWLAATWTVTWVMKARPRWARNARMSGSERWNVFSTYWLCRGTPDHGGERQDQVGQRAVALPGQRGLARAGDGAAVRVDRQHAAERDVAGCRDGAEPVARGGERRGQGVHGDAGLRGDRGRRCRPRRTPTVRCWVVSTSTYPAPVLPRAAGWATSCGSCPWPAAGTRWHAPSWPA